ncbi:MAG: DUF2314 domain-containing protein [Verrucomicrobiales bacterium]|nr:DUF2314 domain-containing protein [Verrucomicrobiales bacterium]
MHDPCSDLPADQGKAPSLPEPTDSVYGGPVKSFKAKPRHDLAEPAIWCAGIGLLCLIAISLKPAIWPLALILGLVYLSIAAGLWQERRGAVIAGAILFSLGVVARLIGLVKDFSWGKVGSAVLFAWLAWRLFAALRRWHQMEDEGAETDEGTEEDKPMISIVLFLRRERPLDEPILARIVEEAWGGNYTSGDEDAQDGFVVGSSPFFLVKSKLGMFAVHNFPSPYFDDVDAVADEIGELRLRHAILEHSAWIAVDLLSPDDDSLPRESFYPAIIRLIYELADEDVLLVYRPETGQANLWSDDVLEALLMPSGEDRFNRVQTNVPVIRVEADDAAMAAAVGEARRRWPEFLEALKTRGPGDSFSIKAPVTVGENTEFIWIEVDGFASDVIFGKLGNEPVALAGMKLGSRVEIPLEDLNDWCYARDGGEPVGLFTLAAINEAERRFQDRNGG